MNQSARSVEYLQQSADRVMIMDLLGRYAWECDHGSPEAVAALFVENGVLEAPALGLYAAGRPTITALIRDTQRTIPNIHHVMSNFVIDLAGDRAKGRCELNEFLSRPEAVYAPLQGWYEDDFVFADGRWWLEHRRVFIPEPGSAGVGKVGEYFADFFAACAKYSRR
jgi:hypothetical protein